MKKSDVSSAIFLLVAANLVASLSDVSLKMLNGEVPTFQYVFIRQLIRQVTNLSGLNIDHADVLRFMLICFCTVIMRKPYKNSPLRGRAIGKNINLVVAWIRSCTSHRHGYVADVMSCHHKSCYIERYRILRMDANPNLSLCNPLLGCNPTRIYRHGCQASTHY